MAHRIDTLPLVGLLLVLVATVGGAQHRHHPRPRRRSSAALRGPSAIAPNAAPTLGGVPIACYGLGDADCPRVKEVGHGRW